MMARLWQGITVVSKADAYLDYLNIAGVPDYQATAGNQEVYVLRRIEGSQAHVFLLSVCDSSAAIHRVSPLFGARSFHPQFELRC